MGKPIHRKNAITGDILCKNIQPKREVRWSMYDRITCKKCLKIEGNLGSIEKWKEIERSY